jgi:hypothetical protein
MQAKLKQERDEEGQEDNEEGGESGRIASKAFSVIVK